ncbi:MAG TPA: dTMP kinase [Candidatus Bilamarchaeaceae archaeon]|nr:dTMP kinase [Candidatus Bilamarchaeaceae archaeon]
MFLVIEGLDGSGKDTQIELLRKKHSFTYFKYPTPGNKRLRAYLEKKENIAGSELVDLFLDDIYAEQEQLAAKKGLVIADRYVYSTIAYEAHLVDFEEIQRRIELKGFIKPDKVILLDLPASVSYERKKKQKMLDRYEEDVAYLEGVRQNFLRLYRDRYLAKKWVKIDASKSINEVNKEILKLL